MISREALLAGLHIDAVGEGGNMGTVVDIWESVLGSIFGAVDLNNDTICVTPFTASDCEKEKQIVAVLNRVLSSGQDGAGEPATLSQVATRVQLRTRVAGYNGSGRYHLSVHAPFNLAGLVFPVWHSAFPTGGKYMQSQGMLGYLRGESSNNPKTANIASDKPWKTRVIGYIDSPVFANGTVFAAALAVAANRYGDNLRYCHFPEED